MEVAERSGGVEFSCAICGKLFSLRVQLLQHTKRNHGLHRDGLHDFAELRKRTANIAKDPLIDGLPTLPSELESSTRTPYCPRPADLHGSFKNSNERKIIDPKREYVTTRGHFTCCMCPQKFTLLPDWFIHYERSHLLESPCAATQKLASIDQPPTFGSANPQEHEEDPSAISLKYPDAGHLTRMRCFLGTLRKELLEAMKTVESINIDGPTKANLKLTCEENSQHDQSKIASLQEHVKMPTKYVLLRCPQCPLTFRFRSALLRHIDRVHSGKETTKRIKKVKRSNPRKVGECILQEVKGQWTVSKPSVKQLKRLGSPMRNGHRNHDIPVKSITSEDKKGDEIPSPHSANTSRLISQSVNYLKEDTEDSWASVKTDSSFSQTDNNISELRHCFTCQATPPNESQPLCHCNRDHSYQLPHRCNTEFKMDMVKSNPPRADQFEAAPTWEAVRLEAQKKRKGSKRTISTTSRIFYPKRCKYCPKWLFSTETFASHLQMHTNLLSSCPQCPPKFQSKANVQSNTNPNHENPYEVVTTSDKNVKHQLSEAPCENSPADATCAVKTNSKLRRHPRQRECSLSPEYLERIGDVREKIRKKRKQFQCQSCSKDFDHKGHFNAHLKRVHPKIPLKTKRKQLNAESHFDELVEAEFECDKCGKLVPTRQALINHRRVHKTSDETTFCRYCSRSFRYRKNFRCHMLIMHDEMPPDLEKHDVLSPGTSKVEGRPTTMNVEKACESEKWKELKPSEDDGWDGTTSSEAEDSGREKSSNADECDREKPNEAEKCNIMKSWKPGKSHKNKPRKTEKWDKKKSVKVLSLPAKLRSSKEDDMKVSMKCISKRKSSTSASKFEQLVNKCDNPYVCLICDLPFRRFEALKMHIKNLHRLGEDQADGLATVIQFQHDLVVESELAKNKRTTDEEFW